jgi:hypothetical protein
MRADTESPYLASISGHREVLVTYMQKWFRNDGYRDGSPKIAVMSFISTIILLQSFTRHSPDMLSQYSLLKASPPPSPSVGAYSFRGHLKPISR